MAMAQGAVAPGAVNGFAPALSAEELREFLEYERIIKFRDAVLAGIHPRVKIPPHLVGKQVNSTRDLSSPNLTTHRTNALAQPVQSTPSYHIEETSAFYNSSPKTSRPASGVYIPISSKSEINPILLEKSDDLIKAEIQLSRQRLERDLRDQNEEHRIKAKTLLQTFESLPNFDISDVLSKALAIVPPSTTTEIEPSVGARSSASDSFDENTFYSSQHDTPEPSISSQGQKESGKVPAHMAVPVDQRPIDFYSTKSQVVDQDVLVSRASLSNDNHVTTQERSPDHYSPPQIQTQSSSGRGNSDSESSLGLVAGGHSTGMNTQGSGIRSTRQGGSTSAVGSQQTLNRQFVQGTSKDLLRQAFEDDIASPLIRAHNLSPLAPQPARVSPLATARDPPIFRETQAADEAPPAQVAALRVQVSGISSADSSPKGAKVVERKKEKKKEKRKRKTKDNANTPDSPYIKPEPHSPSPFAVAPLPRPQKRQRQTGQYAAELNYDEPRYEPEERSQGRPQERYKEVEVREPTTYERYEDRYEITRPRQEPIYRRIDREENYRRVSDGQYARAASPTMLATQYPREGRPVRAVSHANIERRVPEELRYYREPISRASVRPETDRERSRSPIAMGPPRKPVRIVIDEFGNEYIDPSPMPSMRQSMAPPIQYRDSDVVYERAPLRTVSSRAPMESFEEDGVLYHRPSPAVAVPRRVITQPEYAYPTADHRSYRQREYSVRPTMIAPAEEYIQIRGAPEHRQMSHHEEGPREYALRAPSVRPEPVRYEFPREYVGRLPSIRPEAPPREYAASVRPEARRETTSRPHREYSARPIEVGPRREQLHVPEGERYYEEIPSRRPAEVAFIERPRARESSVLVYADDVRREVFR